MKTTLSPARGRHAKASPPGDIARRLRVAARWASKPRPLSLTARSVVVAAATSIAFGPVLLETVAAMAAGSPTLYLLLVPMWAILIGYGVDRTTSGRVINDRELDWISAFVVTAALIIAAYLALPRLPATAALWHLDLLPVYSWLFAGCILAFGVRRAFRGWRILVFVAIGSPGTVILTSAHVGGSTTATALVVAILNALAVWVSMVHCAAGARWRHAAAAALFGALLAVALVPFSAAAAILAPSVLTSAVLVWLRYRPSQAELPHASVARRLPPQSFSSVGVALALSVALLLLLPTASARVTSPGLWLLPEQWSAPHAELSVVEVSRFEWATDFLGPDGSIVRYRVDSAVADRTLFLDVYTAATAGVLSNFSDEIWYGPIDSSAVERFPVVLAGGVAATGIRSGDSNVLQLDEAPWTALTWSARTLDRGRAVDTKPDLSHRCRVGRQLDPAARTPPSHAVGIVADTDRLAGPPRPGAGARAGSRHRHRGAGGRERVAGGRGRFP